MTTIDTSPAADERRSSTRHVLVALRRRWPTLLAVAPFLTLGGSGSGAELAAPLLLLPTAYLLALAAGDRRWTWPLVLVTVGGYVALRAGALVDPRVVLLGLAVAALAVCLVRRRDLHEVLLQGAGLVGFGLVSFGASVVSPLTAALLVAAGWFAHGLWDLWHLYRDAVVARSFAEWCAVIDILTAVAIVLTAASWAR